MSVLDKDIHQKAKAIRYCISNGILPYLEVIVENVREISDIKTVITDLDVLGVEFSRRGIIKRTLFDCKTVNKMSAINRSFWASGIMSFTGCSESYVILSKKASEAHRVSAKTLNVHLFQEQDFDSYAASANINFLDTHSYYHDINNWIAYYKIFENSSQNIKDIGEFINNKLPVEDDFAKALRELVGIIRANRGELDPSKEKHMAIYCSFILSFILVMTPISAQLADVHETDCSQATYEKILRYYVWGGRESYVQRRTLKNAIQLASGNKEGELELPGWEDFVQVSRSFIDAPSELRSSLLPCRGLSLRYVSEQKQLMDQDLTKRLTASNRTKQFLMAASSYLYKATGLPKDFHTNLISEISDLDHDGD